MFTDDQILKLMCFTQKKAQDEVSKMLIGKKICKKKLLLRQILFDIILENQYCGQCLTDTQLCELYNKITING